MSTRSSNDILLRFGSIASYSNIGSSRRTITAAALEGSVGISSIWQVVPKALPELLQSEVRKHEHQRHRRQWNTGGSVDSHDLAGEMEFEACRDPDVDPPALLIQVEAT